ncbi:uncharacterized protein LOC112506461 [Cynara cardunculus var. scolymus]|uniref:uncharacterized protein LOC112506461 n=1 Tax=Cynara cardunculus var. scolymus TaxID=59895 RepID=UPI000D62E1CD|nr:uncharacterized protein LOC112506461 [Cynara cardunculus var. scolymus]
MGCRNGGQFQPQEQDRRSSSIVNDALLLTTMCIIGFPVDVHIKDGSIYSGIFHTASVDDHYAIVLKRARMIKKGSCDSNVANEGVIGTLVIQSEDLVQVVAKRVLLPADGFAGHETGDDTEAVACAFPSNGTPLTEANKTISSMSNVDQPHANQTRCSSGTENGLANGFRPELAIHSSNVLEVNRKADLRGSTKKEESLNDQDDNRKNGSKVPANGILPDGAASSTSKKQETVDAVPSATISSEPSSTPSEPVTSKILNPNRATKEFKLNPGAKIFSPSFPNKRSATPPAMPAGANLAYVPDGYPAVPVATPQPEVEVSPYAHHRPVPVKFVPYGNLISGNGGGDVQHPPPIVGYVANRSQPVRYGGQYHPVQTAPTYVQPSSQNVMVGRLGPVFYVHPLPQDMVPSTTGFSQGSTCSILTPHQVHVPKHQGTGAAQALQLCATPPFIAAGGQAPFVLPSHIPISQPPYPVIRPISVPGSNGFLVSKYS